MRRSHFLSMSLFLGLAVLYIVASLASVVPARSQATATVTYSPADVAHDLQGPTVTVATPNPRQFAVLTAGNVRSLALANTIPNVSAYQVSTAGELLVVAPPEQIDVYVNGARTRSFSLPLRLLLSHLQISADGMALVACNWQDRSGTTPPQTHVWVWELARGRLLQSASVTSDPFVRCAVSPDHNQVVLTNGFSGLLGLLDVSTGSISDAKGAVPNDYRAQGAAIGPASPDHLYLIVESCPVMTNHFRGCGETSLWNVRTQQRLPFRFGQLGTSVEIDPAGTLLATINCHLVGSTMDYCSSAYELEIWDLATGKPQTLESENVWSFHLSADGRYLASLRCSAFSPAALSQSKRCTKGQVDYWEVATRKKLFTVKGANFALTPDSKLLAVSDNVSFSSAEQGHIAFIDTTTGKSQATVPSRITVDVLAFTSDGKALVSVSDPDGQLKMLNLWAVNTD